VGGRQYNYYLLHNGQLRSRLTHLKAPTRELAGETGVVPALHVTVHWAPIRILAPAVQPCTPPLLTRLGGKRAGSVQKCGMLGGHFQFADPNPSGVCRRLLLLRTTAASAKPANAPHRSQMATTAIYRALIGMVFALLLQSPMSLESYYRLPLTMK
jgi:hypothetical protein